VGIYSRGGVGQQQCDERRGRRGGGTTSSSNGYGVKGVAHAASGAGVYGTNDSGYGVMGTSSGAAGVYAEGTGANSYGLYAFSQSWLGAVITTPSSHTTLLLKGGNSGGDLIKATNYDGTNTRFRVSSIGEVYADGSFHSGGADFAEMYPAHGELEPGTVVGIGADGKLEPATAKRGQAVMGVVSDRPTIVGGSTIDVDGNSGKVPVAILGIVQVRASAASGPIHPGDLLCAGREPGTAEKAVWAYPGTIIGKALQALPSGQGRIRMLVTLR